jgi:hypothetical protein
MRSRLIGCRAGRMCAAALAEGGTGTCKKFITFAMVTPQDTARFPR